MIYKEIKERFSDHLWLDVVSKCDLLHTSPVVFVTEDDNAKHLEMAKYREMGPDGAIRVSVKNEEGVSEVSIVLTLLTCPLVFSHDLLDLTLQ